MAIQSISDRNAPPVIGTIRLGMKVKTSSGGERPENADHFVLGDAPQVAAVYGAKPKEIDVIFPSDDLDDVVPTWLKLWGMGAKDASGKMISGKLRCKGNGKTSDGKPGEAAWYEKSDPATGVAPARPCLAEECPDWNDSKGNRSCKPNMQVFVYLPKVSPFGVFKITTTSWTTIKNFHDHLQWIKNLNGGRIKGILFKLVREQRSFKYTDPKTGKQVDRAQWVMLLKPNENKAEIEGMREGVKLLTASTLKWQAPPELVEVPAEDIPYLEAGSGVVSAETQVKLSAAEELLKDPDVNAAFDAMGAAMGSPLQPKDRLILVRKKEGAADLKAAVLEAVGKQIKTYEAKNAKAAAKPAEQAPPPPPAAVAQAPAVPDAGGLI